MIIITHYFYNLTVKFSIKPFKHTRTFLSFTGDNFWHRYKVKGNIDYAKKIVDNTIIALDSIAIDCSDIDSCLRKAFSLRRINPHATFPRWIRNIAKQLKQRRIIWT